MFRWQIADFRCQKEGPFVKDGTIPDEYFHYYNNLPSSTSIKDTLPEPDFLDDDNEEETDDE